jgi:hypothetical protein
MKKHNKKWSGTVNHAYATTDSEIVRQAKSFGKNYSSIDFGFNPDLKPEDFPMKNSMEIGVLMVGSHEISMTKAEAVKIISTLDTAITSTQQRYRVGTLQ